MTARLTSADRVLWPGPGFTKADLWAYVEAVAERLLPHLAGRPLTLLRHPRGVDEAGFLQKDVPASAPAPMERFAVWTPSSQRTVRYAVFRTVDDLRWAANQAAVELHPWFSQVDRPDRPDLLAFDLDPANQRQSVATAAHRVREVLDELGLDSAVKTSGKRGLHLWVPIQRRYDHAELRAFGLAVARACADRHPDELTVEMRKADRAGRLLLDWSRNGRAQTLAAPWSPRAHPGGTVSMPLTWAEVTNELDPTAFTIATAPARGDAWADLPPRQRLERARARLERAGYELVDVSPRARTTH